MIDPKISNYVEILVYLLLMVGLIDIEYGRVVFELLTNSQHSGYLVITKKLIKWKRHI